MHSNLDSKIKWLLDATMVKEVNDNEVVQTIIAKAIAATSERVAVLPYGAFVALELEPAGKFAQKLQDDEVKFAICVDPKVLFISYKTVQSLIELGFINRNETDWSVFFGGLMASGVKLAVVDRRETIMFSGGGAPGR